MTSDIGEIIVTWRGDELSYGLYRAGLTQLIVAVELLSRQAKEMNPGDVLPEFAAVANLGGEQYEGVDRGIVITDKGLLTYGDVSFTDVLGASAVLRARYEYDLRKPLMEADMQQAQQFAARGAILRG